MVLDEHLEGWGNVCFRTIIYVLGLSDSNKDFYEFESVQTIIIIVFLVCLFKICRHKDGIDVTPVQEFPVCYSSLFQ